MEENKTGVTEAELAAAFKPTKKTKKIKEPKKPKDKKKIWSITIFIIGIIVLIAGIVLFVLSLLSTPGLQDGEYLVSAKQWVLENNTNCEAPAEEITETNCEENQVIWQFTEIGKGTLTANSHTNDYDFIWAIEDGKLKVETNWLYTLNNEYDYELNQRDGKLILKNGDEEFKFTADFETE